MKNKTFKFLVLVFLFAISINLTLAQIGTEIQNRDEEGRPVKTYNLIIEESKMTLAGVTAKGMTINGSIPGPTLEFTVGDLAIINVHNKMKEETSIHWHGMILPNYYDGVPYLTTPPIKPDSIFQYRIPINQTGTYWYHSHTMLQEQSGVYGSLVIHPKEELLEYDRELVVVLSDWTNEKPGNILKNLKRGNEWYQIKKGTAVPFSRVIARNAVGAQLKMWRDRMEGADIADIYYPAFLSNGQGLATYSSFKPGEKVRLRFINASASTYFWLDFGHANAVIVASDGVNVVPVRKDRLLFAIAETYDVIVTIPDGILEIAATAQDGSGHTAIRLGSGTLFSAARIGQPDKVAMMKNMAKINMKMGAPSIILNKKKKTPSYLMDKYGMNMDHGEMNHDNMNHGDMNDGDMNHDSMRHNQMSKDSMNHNGMDHKNMGDRKKQDMMNHDHSAMNDQKNKKSIGQNDSKMDSNDKNHHIDSNFDYQTRKAYFNYDFLKSKEPITFPKDIKVNEMLLNLTGNMNRYVWSINGKPLSEKDKIKINSGEVTRITMNNLTMMHHPMHLHGHFFKVINENGDRSPLKHTVNVPPMEKVTIEIYNEEEGDWFFHCHVLYHMMGGMARIFSYDTPRDPRMTKYSAQNLIDETNEYFFWGTARLGTDFNEVELTASSIRYEFNLGLEMDYDKEYELELDYNRYLNDWVRIYGGVAVHGKNFEDVDSESIVGRIGVKYFTPYMFNLNIYVDHQVRPELSIDKELLLFPRIFLEGEVEYQIDFGVVNDLPNGENFDDDFEWSVGLSFMMSGNFSIEGNYSNSYGWGGALVARF